MKYPFRSMNVGDVKTKLFPTVLDAERCRVAAYNYARNNHKKFSVKIEGSRVTVRYLCNIRTITHQDLYQKWVKSSYGRYPDMALHKLMPGQSLWVEFLRKSEMRNYRQSALSIARVNRWVIVVHEIVAEGHGFQLRVMRLPLKLMPRKGLVDDITRLPRTDWGSFGVNGFTELYLSNPKQVLDVQSSVHNYASRTKKKFETRRGKGNKLEIYRVE